MINIFIINFINYLRKFYKARKLFDKSFEELWQMNPEIVQTK